VGTALGQANGIQALDRSRQVIALCGDGGFNMLMCEFLTAVHHKLPVKVVIYNNSAFSLITLEAEGIGVPAYKQGIEFPKSGLCGARASLRRPWFHCQQTWPAARYDRGSAED
jgi:thiamine pyrophosphate-dependent acetolactate synthase large subunit-like protein